MTVLFRRCKHLTCDVVRTFGTKPLDMRCRECKKEFEEGTQDYGVLYYSGKILRKGKNFDKI